MNLCYLKIGNICIFLKLLCEQGSKGSQLPEVSWPILSGKISALHFVEICLSYCKNKERVTSASFVSGLATFLSKVLLNIILSYFGFEGIQFRTDSFQVVTKISTIAQPE